MKGFGDIYNEYQEAYQRYWETFQGQPDMYKEGTVSPTKGELTARDVAALEVLRKQVFFTKSPNWIEPPYEARPIDIFTLAPLPIAANTIVPNILRLTVPKNYIAIINKIGHEGQPAGSSTDLLWSIKIDDKIMPASLSWQWGLNTTNNQYTNFTMKLGDTYNPTPFPMPFILRQNQTFSIDVRNQNLVVNYTVLARLMGYLWSPASGISTNNYPREMHEI